MKWVVLAVVLLFLLLLAVRAMRHRTLGQATVHMAHLRSEADATQVARVLRGLRGVVEVHVDLERRFARITYRKTRVAIEEILRALHAAGF